MSVEYLSAVWKIKMENSGRKLVALALANVADENGECFPSIRYLCEHCSMREAAVREHLAWLCSIQLITKSAQFKDGRQTSNLYTFMPIDALEGNPQLEFLKRGRVSKIERGEGGDFREGGGYRKSLPQEPFISNRHKEEGKGCGTTVPHACVSGFSDRNRRPYPTSEKEMYQILESFGIEPNPDRDGHFYEQMAGTGWRIRGKLIADWVAVYEARVNHTEESCKANHNRK